MMKTSLKIVSVALTMALTVAGSVGFYLISIVYSNATLDESIEQTCQSFTQAVARAIDLENKAEFDLMNKVGKTAIMQDPEVSLFEKQDQLDSISNMSPDIVGFNVTDLQGNSRTRETGPINFGDKVYVKNALLGRKTIV